MLTVNEMRIPRTSSMGKTETLLDGFHDAIARKGAQRARRLYHAPEGVPLPAFHAMVASPGPRVTILKSASVGKSECMMSPLGPLVTR